METTLKKVKWVLDPAHSEILFRVKHLMITNVKGEFRKFEAEVTVEDNDLSTVSALARIDATSIFTNDDSRDVHLKSADFFDIEKYNQITFESTSFRKASEDKYEMRGNLTIRGITKEVTFEVEYGGVNTDPWGNEKAGFSLEGKINRKDWGLNWNAALEAGGFLVGDEVKITAEVQFVKQK